VLREGALLAILAFGSMVQACKAVAERLNLSLVDMRFVKPIDSELLQQLAKSHQGFVTVEEHVISGGAGSAVAEALLGLSIDRPLLMLGLPDRFIDHGEHQQLLALEGLNSEGIEASILKRFSSLLSPRSPRLVAQPMR
jgi:1-deoxy-D-xylulose-5-phosphate synthase